MQNKITEKMDEIAKNKKEELKSLVMELNEPTKRILLKSIVENEIYSHDIIHYVLNSLAHQQLEVVKENLKRISLSIHNLVRNGHWVEISQIMETIPLELKAAIGIANPSKSIFNTIMKYAEQMEWFEGLTNDERECLMELYETNKEDHKN